MLQCSIQIDAAGNMVTFILGFAVHTLQRIQNTYLVIPLTVTGTYYVLCFECFRPYLDVSVLS